MTGAVTGSGPEASARIRGGRAQVVAESFGVASVPAVWFVASLIREGLVASETVFFALAFAVVGALALPFDYRRGLELHADVAIVKWRLNHKAFRWVDVVDVVETRGSVGRIGLVTLSSTVAVPLPIKRRRWYQGLTDPDFDEKAMTVRRWWLDHGGVERPPPPDRVRHPGALAPPSS